MNGKRMIKSVAKLVLGGGLMFGGIVGGCNEAMTGAPPAEAREAALSVLSQPEFRTPSGLQWLIKA